MTDLCALAEKYLVDKCPKLNHTYTPLYHEILQPHRDSFENVLEIGIGTYSLMSSIVGPEYKPGASLRMWKDYFSKARIYGCDIDTSILFSEDRIQTFAVDQSNAESLETLINQIKSSCGKPTIDFIIDDGSHVLTHQKKSLEVLWKYLTPGGIYIIEDIFDGVNIDLSDLPSTFGFSDARCIKNYKGRDHYDAFVAFQKI